MYFLYRCLKHTQICNFKNIRPVGGRVVPRWRDTRGITKLIVVFRIFARVPTNYFQGHSLTSVLSLHVMQYYIIIE
jgi:hypothetical protein